MRKHLVFVVVMMVVTVVLFTTWFVRFLDTMLTQQSSGKILNSSGQVEFSRADSEWSEVTLDQTIMPNTQLRTGDQSELTIWLDSMSRLVIQPNSHIQYLGYQQGKPTWQLITGTANGTYTHPTNPNRSLNIKLNESVVVVNNAAFQIRNQLDEQSITAYDQPLLITLGIIDEHAPQDVTVYPGDTYTFDLSNSVVAIEAPELSDSPTNITLPDQTQNSTTNDIETPESSPSSTLSFETVIPSQPEIQIPPQISNTLSLTIGARSPLTFLWIETGTVAAEHRYRIFRSETQPLDENNAAAYRTTTGTKQTSFAWPLPTNNKTYYVRVCRLVANTCETWSNTITIPAHTFD